MKNLTKKIIPAILLAAPFASLAQRRTLRGTDVPGAPTITNVEQIFGILEKVVNWVAAGFFAIAILFIFYAGFLYLTAGGEAEKVTTAKNQLIYSLVAIAIGLLAFSATTIVKNFLE